MTIAPVDPATGGVAGGDVVGPGSSTDGGVAFFDGTDGNLLKGGLVGGVNLDSDLTGTINFIVGFSLDRYDVSIVSDGVTVSCTVEKLGGGDVRVFFRSGYFNFDATPIASINLVAGSDPSPQRNFIYVLESSLTLTTSTVGFPAVEHWRIADVTLQSAPGVQADGPYRFHAHNDETFDGSEMGFAQILAAWVRSQHATYISGISQTLTITTNGGSADNVDLATAGGLVRQLHEHVTPSFDSSTGGKFFVVNDPVTAFDETTDLNTLLTDSTGGSLSARRFSLVVWCVASEDGSVGIFVNLPSGSYNSDAAAIADADKFSNYNIPGEYKGSGFLIARLVLRHQTSSSGTWTDLGLIDLRGEVPSFFAGGSAATTTIFADNAFKVQDNDDPTKQIDLQAENISAGKTRTLTMSDYDFDFGDTGWASLVSVDDFSTTAPSTSTITMVTDRTAEIRVGTPIRFALSGVPFYAICTAITSSLLTIAGAPLTTGAGDLTALSFGDHTRVSSVSLFVSGTYGDGVATDLLRDDMLSPFEWTGPTAYCVAIKASHASVDTGAEPKINIRINDAAVSSNDTSNGIQLGAANTWVENSAVAITTANYDINHGEKLEVGCTVAGGTGDASDLTAIVTFVIA